MKMKNISKECLKNLEKEKDNWVRCPNCGHKLFKAVEPKLIDGIEIKCHSCKKIVIVARKNGYYKYERVSDE